MTAIFPPIEDECAHVWWTMAGRRVDQREDIAVITTEWRCQQCGHMELVDHLAMGQSVFGPRTTTVLVP